MFTINEGEARDKMDFKELLELEIQSKKRELETAKASGPKYARRADVERDKTERALEEQKQAEEVKQEKLQRKLAEVDQIYEKRRKIQEVHDGTIHDDNGGTAKITAEINESIERRLKAKGHPIRLFGETDEQRSERLKFLESRALLDGDKIVTLKILSYKLITL